MPLCYEQSIDTQESSNATLPFIDLLQPIRFQASTENTTMSLDELQLHILQLFHQVYVASFSH